MPPGLIGALEASLQAAEAFFPSLVAGEAWLPDYSVKPARWNHLAAFFTPTPLVASHTNTEGKIEQKVIDLHLARTFSAQHQMSLRLSATVAQSGVPEWCYDIEGDDMLSKITFKCYTAIAIPVFASFTGLDDGIFERIDAPKECRAVLIFYSGNRETRIPTIDQGLNTLAQALGRVFELLYSQNPQASATTGFSATGAAISSVSSVGSEGKRTALSSSPSAPPDQDNIPAVTAPEQRDPNDAGTVDVSSSPSQNRRNDQGLVYYSLRGVGLPQYASSSPLGKDAASFSNGRTHSSPQSPTSPSYANTPIQPTLVNSPGSPEKRADARPSLVLSTFDPLMKRLQGFIKLSATSLRACKADLWVSYTPDTTSGTTDIPANDLLFHLLDTVFLDSNTTTDLLSPGSSKSEGSFLSIASDLARMQSLGCTISSLHEPKHDTASSSGTSTGSPIHKPLGKRAPHVPPNMPLSSRLGSHARGLSLSLCQKCSDSEASVVWFGPHELATLATAASSHQHSMDADNNPPATPDTTGNEVPQPQSANAGNGLGTEGSDTDQGDNAPHWDFVAAMPLCVSILDDVNTSKSAAALNTVPGVMSGNTSLPKGTYRFVLLLYWTETQEFCGTPHGTRLLTLIGHSAQLALSRSWFPAHTPNLPSIAGSISAQHLELCTNATASTATSVSNHSAMSGGTNSAHVTSTSVGLASTATTITSTPTDLDNNVPPSFPLTRSPSAPPALTRYNVPYNPNTHADLASMARMDPVHPHVHPVPPQHHLSNAPHYDHQGNPHIPRRRTTSLPSSTRFTEVTIPHPPQHMHHPGNPALNTSVHNAPGPGPYGSHFQDVRVASPPPPPPPLSQYPSKTLTGKGYGTVHPVLQRNWGNSGQSEALAYIPTALSSLSLDSTTHPQGTPGTAQGTSHAPHMAHSSQTPHAQPSPHSSPHEITPPAQHHNRSSSVQVGAYLTPPPGPPPGMGQYPTAYYPPVHRRIESYGSGRMEDMSGTGYAPLQGQVPSHSGRYMGQGHVRNVPSAGIHRSTSNASPTAASAHPHYYRDNYARYVGPPHITHPVQPHHSTQAPHPSSHPVSMQDPNVSSSATRDHPDSSMPMHSREHSGQPDQGGQANHDAQDPAMRLVSSTESMSVAMGKSGANAASSSASVTTSTATTNTGSNTASTAANLGTVVGRVPSTGTLHTDTECISLADFHVRLPPMAPPLLRTNSDSALMSRNPNMASSMNPGVNSSHAPPGTAAHAASPVGMPLHVSPLVHSSNAAVLPPALSEFPISSGQISAPQADRSLYHPPPSKPMRSLSVPTSDGVGKVPSFFPSPYDSVWRGSHGPMSSYGHTTGTPKMEDRSSHRNAEYTAVAHVETPVLSYMNHHHHHHLACDDSGLALPDTYPWNTGHWPSASSHHPWTDTPDTDNSTSGGFGPAMADVASSGFLYPVPGAPGHPVDMSVVPGAKASNGTIAFGRKRTRTQGQSGLNLPSQARGASDTAHQTPYSPHSTTGHLSYHASANAPAPGTNTTTGHYSSYPWQSDVSGSASVDNRSSTGGNYNTRVHSSQYHSHVSNDTDTSSDYPSPTSQRSQQRQSRSQRQAQRNQMRAQAESQRLTGTTQKSNVGSAVAPSRSHGRPRSLKPRSGVALRRGKWSESEEAFTNALINAFRAGLLPVPENTTLRTFLSTQLHCAPMRITKKYAKDASIGKFLYRKSPEYPAKAWHEQAARAVIQVLQYRDVFFANVLSRNRIDLHDVVPEIFDLTILDEEARTAVEQHCATRTEIKIPTLAHLSDSGNNSDKSTSATTGTGETPSKRSNNSNSGSTANAHGSSGSQAYNTTTSSINAASMFAQLGVNFTNALNAANFVTALSAINAVTNATTNKTAQAANANTTATVPATANTANGGNTQEATPGSSDATITSPALAESHVRTQAVLSTLGLATHSSSEIVSQHPHSTATADTAPTSTNTSLTPSSNATSGTVSNTEHPLTTNTTDNDDGPHASNLRIRVPNTLSSTTTSGAAQSTTTAENAVAGASAEDNTSRDGAAPSTENHEADGNANTNVQSYAADLLDNSPVPYLPEAAPASLSISTFASNSKKETLENTEQDANTLGLSPMPHSGTSDADFSHVLYPNKDQDPTSLATDMSNNDTNVKTETTGGGSGSGIDAPVPHIQSASLPSFYAPVLTSMKSFD